MPQNQEDHPSHATLCRSDPSMWRVQIKMENMAFSGHRRVYTEGNMIKFLVYNYDAKAVYEYKLQYLQMHAKEMCI